MDDPNITIEEYIRLQTKNAQRHGQAFNWETATYGKVYCEDFNSFTDIEADFLAIVYNDALTSNKNVLSEPTVSIYDAIKTDLDFSISFSDSKDKDYTFICDKDSLYYKLIPIDDQKSEPENDHVEINTESYMAPLPPRDQRHQWLRYQVEGYTDDIVHTFKQRLETIFGKSVNQVHVLDFVGLTEEMRMSETEMGLDVADTLCFQLGGARRTIPDKGDLRDYWIEISLDRDFLGLTPSYVYIRDPGTANVPYLLAQYLFRHAKGRKSGARLFGGHFIGCLAAHFGLVSDEGLMGLSVITRKLLMIDLHELASLKICVRLGNTWGWVAPRLKRQSTITAGTLEDAEGAHDEIEGDYAVPAPMQAPQPPPAAAQTRTIP
ncbi:hypothetical protein Tco_0622371 [Tanacetum coccineum]